MKKLFILIGLFFGFGFINVYASNDVDYHLTITDDYQFQEVITYSITDYKQVANGDNHFYSIINDDVYTDIFGKTKYNKTVKKESNRYVVVLKHIFTEYTFSNSNFLNSCFQNGKYVYDIDNYSFKSTGVFNCRYGDSLKITITTNKNVTNTNATVSGTNYVFNVPSTGNFAMNMQIAKNYDESNTTGNTNNVYDDADGESENGDSSNTDSNGNNSNGSNEEEAEPETENGDEFESAAPGYGHIVLLIAAGVVCGIALFVVVSLKIKKDRINKL